MPRAHLSTHPRLTSLGTGVAPSLVCSGLLDRERALRGELDAWCRERGVASRLNDWVAAVAVRQATAPSRPGRQRARALAVFTAPAVEGLALPEELRHWPATWRYRVAAHERAGLERAEAVRRARVEHDAIVAEGSPVGE